MAANLHNFTAIDRVYALTLLELAQKAQSVPQIAEELNDLTKIIDAEPGLVHVLSSLIIPIETREISFSKIFKGRLSDLLYRFLVVVIRHDRFGNFDGIAHAYAALVDDAYGTIQIEAYTASPLDQATSDRIVKHIGSVTNRNVRLGTHVEPAMISGIRLQFGDLIVDGSVATQLRKMREVLVEAGKAASRTALDKYIKETPAA